MAVPAKHFEAIIAPVPEKARNVTHSHYNSILELNQPLGAL